MAANHPNTNLTNEIRENNIHNNRNNRKTNKFMSGDTMFLFCFFYFAVTRK